MFSASKIYVRGLLFVGTILLSWVAEARTYNYEDVPMGERSFGMGHACMALSGDVSNMFYNPATLAYGESSQVSASLSSYARTDTRTGEFVSLFRSAQDNISRGGFLAIPSMVGGNLKWDDWQWGGSILVPYMYSNSGTVELNAQDAASFESKFSTVWMGAFLARKYGNQNFGVSMFYASHEIDEKFFFVTTSVSPISIRFVERNTNSAGVVMILGGTYEYSDRLSLGYSLRAKPFVFGGSGEFSDATSGASTAATADQFQTKFLPIPTRASVGMAYKPRSDLTFAADLHLYVGATGNYKGDTNSLFNVDSRSIVNVMMGAEYFYWKDVGFRLGFFTNMSAAKEVATYLTALDDKVHMFGGTAAIVFDKPTGSISLGGYVEGGQGSSGTLDQSPHVTRRSNYIYGFVTGSNYKF